jgi:outer membrane protein OmpA-like peptidoglycan-associated protein
MRFALRATASVAFALLPVLVYSPPASAQADHAVVLTDSALSVEGLATDYKPDASVSFVLRVPRQNVLRARAEVAVMRDDVAGAPIYQSLREYDRFTEVNALEFEVELPAAERHGQLALLVRVRGLRNKEGDGPVEAFEEALTYRLRFAEAAAVVATGKRLEGRVFFGLDESTLDPKGKGQAAEWSKVLNGAKNLSEIRVEGHADQIGGSNYNLQLSIRRAESVRAALISGGVPGNLIRVVGFGFSRPNVQQPDVDSAKGVWENRRAEVVWFDEEPLKR